MKCENVFTQAAPCDRDATVVIHYGVEIDSANGFAAGARADLLLADWTLNNTALVALPDDHPMIVERKQILAEIHDVRPEDFK